MYKATAIVHGNPINSKEGNIEIFSPLNQQLVGTVPSLSEAEINEAFCSAEIAFPNWKSIDSKTKQKYLAAFAGKIKEHANLISNLIHQETGKSLLEANEEVNRSVEYVMESVHAFDKISENPEEYKYEKNVLIPKHIEATYLRVPHGVALTISPFNYPVNLMITKIVPAILMGNCVVHKSATQGSISGWYIAKLFNELVIDKYQMLPGVLNYITGKGRDINSALSKQKNIKSLSFTGSTEIGLNLSKQFSDIPKQLEMGGLNTAIVCKNTDISFAAKEIAKGAFTFSGQRCTSIQKVLVNKEIFKEFKEAIKKEVLNFSDEFAPVINDYAKQQVKEFYFDALNNMGELLTPEINWDSNDLFIKPIVVLNVSKDSLIYKEEIFGPIIAINQFENLDDAISEANATEYGLQASIFCQDIETSSNIALSLDFGRININASPSRSPDILPFSGTKKSGLETQGIFNSLYFFSQFKGVVLTTNKTENKN